MTSSRYTTVERAIALDTIAGTYRARTTNFEGRSVYGHAKDLDTARAWLHEARAARKAKRPAPPSPLQSHGRPAPPKDPAKTLESFWLDWYEQKETNAKIGEHVPKGWRREVLRPATLNGYELLMRLHVIPRLGSCTLEPPTQGGIAKSDVVAMRDDLAREGKAASTQNEILVLLRRLLDEAAEEGLPVVNVARSVKSIAPANPKKRKQQNLRPLDATERLTVVQALPASLQAGGHLAAFAAHRSAEAMGVELADFDLWNEIHGHTGWVVLARQRRHESGSSRESVVPWLKHRAMGQTRPLPLAPSLTAYLRWYIEHMFPGYEPGDPREHEYLVRTLPTPHKFGVAGAKSEALRPQGWNSKFRRTVGTIPSLRYEDLGFDITPHNLREDCLSELKNVTSPYARSSYAGHHTIHHEGNSGGSVTTDDSSTYSKHFVKDLVPVALAIEDLIQEATGGQGLIPALDMRLTAPELALAAGVSTSLIKKLGSRGVLPYETVAHGARSTRRVFAPETVELVHHHLEDRIAREHPDTWSVKEAGRLVGLHHQTLRREITAGHVPSAVRIPADNPAGFIWRFSDAAVYEAASLKVRGSISPPDRADWPVASGRLRPNCNCSNEGLPGAA